MARYVSNAERGAANLVALVLSYRDKHKQLDKSIEDLAKLLDEKIILLKNEILGGASSAFDTLGELQKIIEQNQEGIRVLEALAAGHVRFDRLESLSALEKSNARTNIGAVSFEELEAAVNAVIPMTPTVSVQKTGTVTTVTTTDAKGTTTAEVKDGEKGAHYTPLVDDEGNLSWTNNGGLPNPLTKNIRGPRGLQGQQGVPGIQGEKGEPGAGLTIHAEYASYEELVAKHPTGEEGDAYLINGDVWYWAEENKTWKNGGPLRGPQGVRGPQGFTFTPHLQSDGTLYFTNDGGLDNPTEVNLRGPRGFHFTPTVDSNGNITWTNDGGLTNPVAKNIRGPRGYTYTPYLNSDGVLSFTNDGGLSNPTPVDLTGPRGYHFTPALDADCNLSWSNNGNLTNPATQNIRGYHFTPSLDADCNLSWTNNGGMTNPATQNIRGFHFTPSVDDNGNISWTNNGGMTNPATKNIRGPRGYYFTPSVSDKGIISWTNNGGLSNPSSVDIKGPSFVTVNAQLANATAETWDDWEAILDSGELKLMPGDFTNLRVNDMVVWPGLFYGSESGELGLQNFVGFAIVTSIDKANSKVGITGGTLLFGMPGAQGKSGNNIIHYTPSRSFEYTYDRWKLLFRQPGSVTTFEADKSEVFGWHENDVLVVIGSISDRETASVVALYRYNYWTDLENNDGVGAGLINATLISGIITGVEGKQGEKGDTGYVFTPSVNSSGDLSWSNNGNLTNPATVNIKGPKGDQGEKGEKGDGLRYEDLTAEQIAQIKGPKGDQGIQGPEGPQGKAFTYDDFTEAQLEALRGPQGETGQSTKAVTIFFKSAKTFTLAELKAESGTTMSLGGVDEKTDYASLNVGDVIAIPGTISDQNGAPCVLYGHFQSLVFAGSVGITFKVIGGIYGVAGKDGSNGKDGANGTNGKDGTNGTNGKDGADGKTPQVSFRLDSSGNLYYTVTI